MQCEEGKFHQNSEFCRVDFQPLKSEHGGPFVGRILVTTFNNPWYYIVRFDVRDLVHIDEKGKCPCGRNCGIILSAVEGRVISTTLTCEGKLVTLRELDDALNVLEGVDEYRLEQLSRKAYDLHLVSQRSDRSILTEEASGLLKEVYGEEAKVSVIYDEALSPEDSGKYSVAKTLFPVNIENYLE
jgi:phenylacetate-coenzyme A ligase PaaK-like adenylate-forming protein